MRLSLAPDLRVEWDDLLARCAGAADQGWPALWIFDHLLRPEGEPPGFFPECWTTMAAIAGAVPTVAVGSLVSAATFRSPMLVAAMATTMAQVTHGRFTLGLGAGGDPDEHAPLGIPFPPGRARLADLEEAVLVVRALTTPGPARLTTAHHRIDVADTGVAAGSSVPLLLGTGGGPVGLDLVARHADAWHVWAAADTAAALGRRLDLACERHGRADPVERGAQVVYVPGPLTHHEREAEERRWPAVLTGGPAEIVDVLGRYADAGVADLVVNDVALDPARRNDDLGALLALAGG